MSTSCHVPVLLNEVLEGLKAQESTAEPRLFLDCTFGGGGHSRAILEASDLNYLVAIDRNSMVKNFADQVAKDFPGRFEFAHSSFSNIGQVLNSSDLINSKFGQAKFSGILADLGLSSDQLSSNLGFSFLDTEALDMRMDLESDLTAEKVVNTYTENALVRIFKSGGAEGGARIVAQKIIAGRPFDNAKDLAQTIAGALPVKFHKAGRHPATIFFQAIRIEVNSEMEEIKALLELAPKISSSGTRLAIISFHSLEDSLVTKTLRAWQNRGNLPALHPRAVLNQEQQALGSLLTKKAISASSLEEESNPRSRSALLRLFEFN